MEMSEEEIQQRIEALEKELGMEDLDSTLFDRMGPAFKLSFLENMKKYEKEFDNDTDLVDMKAELHKRLDLPDESKLDDHQVTEKLHQIVDILAQFHICLDFTDHLSDRELYNLLLNNLLEEGFRMSGSGVNSMEHIDASWGGDPDVFERYYGIGDIPFKVRREAWLQAKAESYRNQPIPKLLSKQ